MKDWLKTRGSWSKFFELIEPADGVGFGPCATCESLQALAILDFRKKEQGHADLSGDGDD